MGKLGKTMVRIIIVNAILTGAAMLIDKADSNLRHGKTVFGNERKKTRAYMMQNVVAVGTDDYTIE